MAADSDDDADAEADDDADDDGAQILGPAVHVLLQWAVTERRTCYPYGALTVADLLANLVRQARVR